jgi:hypothetical protein
MWNQAPVCIIQGALYSKIGGEFNREVLETEGRFL